MCEQYLYRYVQLYMFYLIAINVSNQIMQQDEPLTQEIFGKRDQMIPSNGSLGFLNTDSTWKTCKPHLLISPIGGYRS